MVEWSLLKNPPGPAPGEKDQAKDTEGMSGYERLKNHIAALSQPLEWIRSRGWVLWAALGHALEQPRTRRRLGGVLLLLSPLLLTFCCQWITLRSLGKTFVWFGGHPAAAALTSGLLFLTEFALLLLLGRPFWAVCLPALPITVLSIVSTVKELVNGSPLLISDLSMASRAGAIAGFVRPGMSWGRGTLPAVVLLLLLLTALALLYRGFLLTPGRYRTMGWELTTILLGLALFTAPLQSFVSGETGETQAGRNDRLGLLLGLYSAGVNSAMSQPGDYTEDNLNRILLELEAQADPEGPARLRPSVVLVVSESFFDVTTLPGLTFDRDPLENFHALSQSWPTGTFLSNTYGGGTGNVEMELFTGIPSAFLGAGESLTTLSQPGIYRRLPSIVDAFSQEGYRTVMVHTYDDSLYNRGVNLPQIGFDVTVYQEDFPKGAHEAGGYLSDHTLTQELIARYEARGDKPLFLYGLSMENHPPYHAGKFFGEPSGLGTASSILDEAGVEAVDCLALGLRDADAALAELLDYFDSQTDPVIVVFLGDHLPGLYVVEDESLYAAMGCCRGSDTQQWSAEEMKRMHSTTFLVWNNFGARLPVPGTVSCTTLGAQLLSWAGVQRPLYFQWVDRLSSQILLYRSRLFVDGTGNAYDAPPEDSLAEVADWKNLVYDMIYGKGYIAEKLTGRRQA